MSDRKQINKYYPPDYDWKKDGSINKYRGTHHLRDRAKKLDQGILVVRFEMPYSVWCLGCNSLIGIGVRFNAEKKQVGNFFTTKILQFEMKCHQCDQKFIIETDPENTDYKIISGLRKRIIEHNETDLLKQYGSSSEGNEDDEQDTLEKLEIQKENIKKANKTNPQLDKLAELMGNRSGNDYKLSSVMRKSFRESKKQEQTELNRQQSKGIIIPLLKETQQDIDSAKEIDFKFNNLKRKLDDNLKFKKELIKIQPTINNNNNNNINSNSKIEQTLKKKLKIDPSLLKNNNNNNGKSNVNSIFSSSLY